MGFGRSTAVPAGAGHYEQWASRVQAWGRDASTPLGDLPALTDDTFDQETCLRLIAHVNDAIGTFMKRWQRELSDGIARARTAHELGSELVRLRHLLEPRMTLVNVPPWPAPIRDALRGALVSDVEGIQRELEQAFGRSVARGQYDRGHSDALVEVIRRNPLTALVPSAPPAAGGALRPPETAPPGSGAAAERAPSGRRILL